MKRIILSFILLFSFLYASEYVIDDKHSHVSFSIKHLMISNVKGEFKSFDADLEFDAKAKVFKKIEASIDVSSIDTGIKKRDAHLRSSDFFDVEKYPTIKFVATKISTDKIIGNFTMHGVTKEIVLTPEVHGVIMFKGSKRVGFTLSGKINRKDFGLTWNKLIEGGGVAVGEVVKITVDIEAMEL